MVRSPTGDSWHRLRHLFQTHIHLLQQDDDEIHDYVDLFFDSKAEKKHQYKAARYDKKKVKNSEERKKSAAIECLQEFLMRYFETQVHSTVDNDIETLVEELCHKLKNLEQHDEGNATNSQVAITSSSESDSSSSELENPAERYYAAFPALHGKDQNSTPNESQSVWKNNPITKPKADQTGEIEAESSQEELHPKHNQQEQLSPKTLNRKKKKQTVKKLHAKRTPSRKDDSCYRVCRFLSLPNGSLNIENPATQAHSLQDQELCSQVETMLKEMLLQKEEQALKMPSPEGRMRKPLFVGDTAWENSPEGTDGSVSPELQEDDSWYTQPIDILFTSEEPRQRLYKRNNSSSASPYQQRSGSISPISPNDSLNQQSLNESPKESQFLFPYSSSDTSETKNCFPPDPTFSLFNQSEPKAIPSQNSDLNPDMSGFPVLSPFDNLPQAAPSSEREERYRANSFTENISNSLSLTTVSDLEDINKGVDDLDFDINLTSPDNLLDHQYMEQFMNTANDQEVYYWDNNLQSFDGFLPWTMATTWPSKVLVDDLMPVVSWEERYEGYSADFYNHLKLGKIWQVWDVNYQKITGAYCSPWKNLLQTCWSDHGLFGMSNHWNPDTHRQQADIWGNYGICSESTSWGDYGKLKDSYQQSWLDEGPGTLRPLMTVFYKRIHVIPW
uniref:Uncharacterized protein n=1 Tax=Magallana gigas TaxID=29159 RepID=A0A8W8IT28_MAGGI